MPDATFPLVQIILNQSYCYSEVLTVKRDVRFQLVDCVLLGARQEVGFRFVPEIQIVERMPPTLTLIPDISPFAKFLHVEVPSVTAFGNVIQTTVCGFNGTTKPLNE